MRRLFRFLLLLALVGLVFAGVGYYIYWDSWRAAVERYHLNVTRAVETAVRFALFDATRTAESVTAHYRVITLRENEFLADVAARYNTTVEVIRMANSLLPNVEAGSGQQLIVPEDVQRLNPPRRFKPPYYAVVGDTLPGIAARFGVSLDILELDNPILTLRSMMPGDIVFIAELL